MRAVLSELALAKYIPRVGANFTSHIGRLWPLYDAILDLKWTENNQIVPSKPAVRISVSSHEKETENIGDGSDDEGGKSWSLKMWCGVLS